MSRAVSTCGEMRGGAGGTDILSAAPLNNGGNGRTAMSRVTQALLPEGQHEEIALAVDNFLSQQGRGTIDPPYVLSVTPPHLGA